LKKHPKKNHLNVDVVEDAKNRKELRMQRVVIESPYKGNKIEMKLNELYGEMCMHDCLVNHNESPYASHLLYTRKYVLRDWIPEDRKLGIEAGFFWRDVAEKTVFYVDLGMTEGMKLGAEDCEKKGKSYEIRKLPNDIWEWLVKSCSAEMLPVPERSE
jgi:hypothetical protein